MNDNQNRKTSYGSYSGNSPEEQTIPHILDSNNGNNNNFNNNYNNNKNSSNSNNNNNNNNFNYE